MKMPTGEVLKGGDTRTKKSNGANRSHGRARADETTEKTGGQSYISIGGSGFIL